MMGSQLHQVLRSLCFNTGWKYAVFWKLKRRIRMMLTWEDAYYDNKEHPEKKWSGNTLSDSHNAHFSHDPLGLAVAKMSYHVYSLGEGIVGHVAVTGKHLWVMADKHGDDPNSPFEYCDGWQTQFSAGIKTIAVVAVIPHGVIQLGSLNKIPEDFKVVSHIRDVFFGLQDSLAGHTPSVISNSMESSCVSDVSTRTSGSEIYQDCICNLRRSNNKKGTVFWSTQDSSPGKRGNDSCIFSLPGGYLNKTVEETNKHKDPQTSIAGPSDGDNLQQIHERFPTEQHEEPPMRVVMDTKFESRTNGLLDAGDCTIDNSTSSLATYGSKTVNLSDPALEADCSVMDYSYVSSEFFGSAACDDKHGMFYVPEFPDVHSHKKSANVQSWSTSIPTKQTFMPLRFSAGYELYEALGPAFQEHTLKGWEAENAGTRMSVETLEETCSSNLLMTNSGTEHLLEAVIAKINHKDAEADSLTSVDESVKSLTSQKMPEPCMSDVGTISSAGCSFDCDTLNSMNSSGACGMLSSKVFSSTSCSRGSGHIERPQEPVKTNKKRARPGESCRPRPRDRQLIQDRIKELRELVPNGSKCSIDSLLERTIRHMLFMQSITKHADKLNNCITTKVFDKESGFSGSSSHEQGSSWAVELGSNMKVCPIMVENINMNGEMLIEMLWEDCSHFLEIVEAIKNLGLTILKGGTEAFGEKTRMSFVVEGQNNRSMHRMDILWSLMQLLQPRINI